MSGLPTRLRETPIRTSAVVGAAYALGLLVYQVVIPAPLLTGLLRGNPFAFSSVAVVSLLVVGPFLLGAGSTYLALERRAVTPALALFAGSLAALALVRPTGDRVFIGLVFGGALVVSLAALEWIARALVRIRTGFTATDRAVLVGVLAAAGYTALFARRVLVPEWQTPDPIPPAGPMSPLEGAMAVTFFFGLYLLVVGAPIAMFVRYRLVVPIAVLVPVLLADWTVVWLAWAEGELVVAVYFVLFPVLVLGVLGIAALEFALRRRLDVFPPSPLG